MKLLAALVLTLAASTALAHVDVSCPTVPKDEKKPQIELQKKLEGEGWTVNKIQEANGCYEVHATDVKGAKVEAFFHPKTFVRVYPQREPTPGKK